MLFLCCVQYFDSYAVVSLHGMAKIYPHSREKGAGKMLNPLWNLCLLLLNVDEKID